MALVTAIAYDVERNLGRAYNEIMSRLLPRDHCCFLDHDAVFTTRDWYRLLLEAIERYPDAGLFGAMTNRIGNKEQIPPGAPSGHDMQDHRRFGLSLHQQYGSEAIDVTHKHLLSGVVLCLSHATWEAIGGFKSGMMGVDNAAHRDVKRVGKRVYLLRGLYTQHHYRADGVGHVNPPRAVKT
jgi:GT2 family glycosyltransferase